MINDPFSNVLMSSSFVRGIVEFCAGNRFFFFFNREDFRYDVIVTSLGNNIINKSNNSNNSRLME